MTQSIHDAQALEDRILIAALRADFDHGLSYELIKRVGVLLGFESDSDDTETETEAERALAERVEGLDPEASAVLSAELGPLLNPELRREEARNPGIADRNARAYADLAARVNEIGIRAAGRLFVACADDGETEAERIAVEAFNATRQAIRAEVRAFEARRRSAHALADRQASQARARAPRLIRARSRCPRLRRSVRQSRRAHVRRARLSAQASAGSGADGPPSADPDASPAPSPRALEGGLSR